MYVVYIRIHERKFCRQLSLLLDKESVACRSIQLWIPEGRAPRRYNSPSLSNAIRS